MGPVILVILIAFLAVVWLAFSRSVTVPPHLRESILALRAREAVRDPQLLTRCLWLLALVNLGFCFHGPLHLEPATIVLLGASLFMLAGHVKGKAHMTEELQYLTDVEWKTIFFFIGLFILVGGLVKVGAIRAMADQLVNLTRGNPAGTTFTVLWGPAFLSAIVDNIPYVAAMNPLIVDLARSLHPDVPDYTALVHQPDILPLWWALALGACLGGNGTIAWVTADRRFPDNPAVHFAREYVPAGAMITPLRRRPARSGPCGCILPGPSHHLGHYPASVRVFSRQDLTGDLGQILRE